MPTVRIRIEGLVQGVFFRAKTKEKSDELKLTGWVRNNDDGAVEIHAEGPEEKLRELELWCRRGPPAAQVKSVSAEEVPGEDCGSFEIRL